MSQCSGHVGQNAIGTANNAAAMSTYRMLGDLGYVAGPIALGLATVFFGPDIALAATAVLLVAVAALFGRFAPEPRRPGRF